MNSKTSSAALTTRNAHTARTFGRPRIITVFTQTVADPARALVAAIYAWCRIAVPVADPNPCTVAWCVNCYRASTTPDWPADGGAHHHSAAALIEATSYGTPNPSYRIDETALIVDIRVERYQEDDGTDFLPTTVCLQMGDYEPVELTTIKARDIAAALDKAVVSARSLADRGGAGVRTGAVTIVRLADLTVQVGALCDDGGPVVFVNQVSAQSAAVVRAVARGEGRDREVHTWDFTVVGAERMSSALTAAAALVVADRAAAAMSA